MQILTIQYIFCLLNKKAIIKISHCNLHIISSKLCRKMIYKKLVQFQKGDKEEWGTQNENIFFFMKTFLSKIVSLKFSDNSHTVICPSEVWNLVFLVYSIYCTLSLLSNFRICHSPKALYPLAAKPPPSPASGNNLSALCLWICLSYKY